MNGRLTKKDLALSLHASGRTVEEIAKALKSPPVSIRAYLGYAPADDFSATASQQNEYARAFRGVLRFRDVETARESVAKIDALYTQYLADNDGRGQHQAQLCALIGKNRAEGVGKVEEARLFFDWLVSHTEPRS